MYDWDYFLIQFFKQFFSYKLKGIHRVPIVEDDNLIGTVSQSGKKNL